MFNAQMYPYSQIMPQIAPQSLVRVNGIEGAKAFSLGANSCVALFDSNADVFYVKSTDNAGFPTIRVFEFKEVDTSIKKVDTSTYITREEMENYVEQFIQSITGTNATDKSTANADD